MTQTTVPSEPRTDHRGRLERRIGVVESDVRDKTIKIRFDFTVCHPKYGKLIRRRTSLHAHDERNEAKKGDLVEIASCRPISKTKSWRLTRVLRRYD